ncbi:DEAD/DEAH box helicase [Leptothrix ochracea]|uniref:DEAD/DEAH box helicase n=1 Tax=Leptothrix ochracea TaxID=735331 RepID=UPI0034E23042
MRTENQRFIIRQLLQIDLERFAKKLKLASVARTELTRDLIIKSLGLLNQTSSQDDDFNKQTSILIAALLWSHAEEQHRDSLRQILTPMLAKSGFSPSIALIDTIYKTEGIYSPNSSYFEKLRIIAAERAHSVNVGNKQFTLTKFQYTLWHKIDDSHLLGVSAPTSAGKSFLIYLKIIDFILKGKTKFVYIVPTLSLITQVTSDLSKMLRRFSVRGFDVLNTYESVAGPFIFVITQERALSLFSDDGIKDLDLLVVDEIQNIERVANDGEDRSKILYDVLKDIKNDVHVDKVILSGPRLKNVSNLGFEIFGEISDEHTSESPPVLNITYAISKEKQHYYINQYSSALSTPLQLEIKNGNMISGIGGALYNEKFNNYLHHVLLSLNGSINIVFSPTSLQARKSAKSFYEKTSNPSKEAPEKLHELSRYISSTVHPHYDLSHYVREGIAYHTGKTPPHVRKSLEIAASEGILNYIFCTTTLMQGINLPANNVVIRNPNLFIKNSGNSAKLSAYEFANLRGRAGRLLVDFIGRTIVLDESSFISNEYDGETQELFGNEYKEIKTGYQFSYEKSKDIIDHHIATGERQEDEQCKHLTTYIRYTLLKYGLSGLARLQDSGININNRVANYAIKQLESLKFIRPLSVENRYWDPLDLAELVKLIGRQNLLPKSVWDSGACNKIIACLNLMHNYFPYYFNKYIGNAEDSFFDAYIFGISKAAESFSRETPLNEILNRRFGNKKSDTIETDIDKEISKITNKVSFGLPMLLKPIADIENTESHFIPSLEYGAYRTTTKILMDRGTPRETAIRISNIIKQDSIEKIRDVPWASVLKKLTYWEQRQIEHLLP